MDEELKDMADRYAKANSVGRQDILRKEVHTRSLKGLRDMAGSFYGDEVPTDHSDTDFLAKLVAWAVVEKSGILNQETRASLDRNRQAFIDHGPNRAASVDEKAEERKEKREGGKHMKVEKRHSAKDVGDSDVQNDDVQKDKKSKIAALTGKSDKKKSEAKHAEAKKPEKSKTSGTRKSASKQSLDSVVFRSKLTGPVYATDTFAMKSEVAKSLPEKGPLSFARVFSPKGKIGDFVKAISSAKSSGKLKLKADPSRIVRGSIKRMIRKKMISKAT